MANIKRVIITSVGVIYFVFSANFMSQVLVTKMSDITGNDDQRSIIYDPGAHPMAHNRSDTTHSYDLLGFNVHVLSRQPLLWRHRHENKDLLIIVHSGPENRPQRDAVRNTWGKSARALKGPTQVTFVFITGTSQEYDLNTKLLKESLAYRDMVVIDIVDTYRNLSLKSVFGLIWVNTHHRDVDFILKADDDIYLDVRSIVKLIHTNKGVIDKAGVVGSVNIKARVMRQGLWGLTPQEHPWDVYPPYCSGNSYLVSNNITANLLTALQRVNATYVLNYLTDKGTSGKRTTVQKREPRTVTKPGSSGARWSSSETRTPINSIPFVPFEDIFVTGYLADHSGYQCQGHSGFPHWIVSYSKGNLCKMSEGKLFAIHNVDYVKMYSLHKELLYLTGCHL